MSYHFFIDLALILLSTKLLGLVTQKIQMPQVVGALLAGLILGPAGLNILKETGFLSQLSELGVVVLMFSAGVGTDIHELKNSGKAGFFVALLGVLVPQVMGTGLAWGCRQLGLIPPGDFMEYVFIGTILTATSVSITVEALREMGKLETKAGNTILAAALIDDVLGLIALTVVSSLSGGGDRLGIVLLKIVLFFVFAFAAAYAFQKLFNWMIARKHEKNLHRYPILAFAMCLIMAYCGEKFFGVADITGAYAAGLAISLTSKSKYIQTKFEPLSYLLLTPVFFASVGINVQLNGINKPIILFSALLLLISVISKFIGCGLGARLCGFSSHDSVVVGTGMICRGEVALIVANRGLALGILSASMMTPVIITVIGGTILTPILLKLVFNRERAPVSSTMEISPLLDHYQESEQLDRIGEQLLRETRSISDSSSSDSKKPKAPKHSSK